MIITRKRTVVDDIKSKIKNRFDVKDLGGFSYFLGMRACKDRNTRTLILDQKTYTEQIIKRFNMIED
jgi:hypothetical protein